jgi:hypothetical protein
LLPTATNNLLGWFLFFVVIIIILWWWSQRFTGSHSRQGFPTASTCWLDDDDLLVIIIVVTRFLHGRAHE